nr:tRNA (adenosine(37)-N6)-threonylcarbamoyltransferase complex dimerization subunit type 1 TsaB [bacterium]
MNVLVLDTSGPSCGVGICVDGAVRYEAALLHGRTHSEAVIPLVEDGLGHLAMSIGQMDVFCAVTGPGSFTGVRIGVAVAQAMAQAGGKRCVALDALEVLAAGIGPGSAVAAWMDARRDQVYEGFFSAFNQWPADGRQRAVDVPRALEDLKQEKGPIRFVGDGALAHREEIIAALGENALMMPACFAIPRMAAAAQLAGERAQSGQSMEAVCLQPTYLRLPQAERERLARLGAAT